MAIRRATRVSMHPPGMVLLLLGSVCAGFGCYHNQAVFSPAPVRYGFELMNRTGEQIKDAEILWGQQSIGFGWVPPNGNASNEIYNDPIPSTARVNWKDLQNIPYSVTMDVKRRPDRPGNDGYFVCVLLPDKQATLDAVSQEEARDLYHPTGHYHFAANGQPRYIVATHNATEQPLAELCVRFGEYQVNGDGEADALSHDLNAGWRFVHGLPYLISETAQVMWQTPDGKRHAAEVPVQSQLPKELEWQCLVMVIEGDDAARLAIVPWSREPRWWMTHRP